MVKLSPEETLASRWSPTKVVLFVLYKIKVGHPHFRGKLFYDVE